MNETESPQQGDAPAIPRRSRRRAFAEQELRLISSLVLLIGLGLFFALPFVLSIGSVVFLPVVTALVLTVILSPLADKLNGWGLPNALASFAALIIFFAILVLALATILQPAIALFDDVPAMAQQVMARFGEVREQFAWVASLNKQLATFMNTDLPLTMCWALSASSVRGDLSYASVRMPTCWLLGLRSSSSSSSASAKRVVSLLERLEERTDDRTASSAVGMPRIVSRMRAMDDCSSSGFSVMKDRRFSTNMFEISRRRVYGRSPRSTTMFFRK